MTLHRSAAAAATLILAVGAAPPVSAHGMDAYRWKKRVVVVFAPDAGDPQLARQRREVATLTRQSDDRDLVLVAAIGKEGAALRQHYRAPRAGFEVLLIGKDGGVAQRSSSPIPAARLVQVIDAMPMRQQEMGRKR